MDCPACHAANHDSHKFCTECGTALPRPCPSCGKANAATARFCGECGSALAVAPARPATPRAAEAERRQLTVMFCDLVGSTELSTRMDPEDLRDLLSAYQDSCRGVIARYDGFIARYMGDGILVYFGYPQAHEDDGERAIRAGLGIVAAVTRLRLRPDVELRVRIGIATGLVVVGDIVGEGAAEERAVLGETPNLAARLQGLAEPNTVIVSPATRRLTEGRFWFIDRGEHALKGIPAPVRAWRVGAESSADSRFAQDLARQGPILGRAEEVAMVQERWRRAVTGDGQIVLVSGEAGIGKSRLVEAVVLAARAEPHQFIHFACSPYHAAAPLHPFLRVVERASGFTEGMDEAGRRAGLTDFVHRNLGDVPDALPILANMLAIPLPADGGRLPGSPQRIKQRTLDLLGEILERQARRQPLLMLFEDAHWCDPTSLELLARLVPRIPRHAFLLLVTFRPGFSVPWLGQPNVMVLHLARLSRDDSLRVIATLAGKPLPAVVVETIIEKTDGVPLFLEELTRTVLESDWLVDGGDRYVLTGPLPPLAIPSTIHDSLMARLDRLPSAKEVAQIGAAIGREFDYPLIAAVAGLADDALQAALDKLRDAEILFHRGEPPDSSYHFKHALLQDAAYESLLRSRRQVLHGRIVEALEAQFPDTVTAEPAVLARHCEAASRLEAAASYYQKAGLICALASGMNEALVSLEKGLAVAQQIPEPARDPVELGMRMTMILPLRSTRGLGSEAVENNYRAAAGLVDRLGAESHRLPVLYGLYSVVWARGDIRAALERAEDIEERAADALADLVAQYALGLSRFFLGENAACQDHFDRVMAAYDPAKYAPLALTYAIEFGVGALNYGTLSLMATGRYAAARDRMARADRLARELNHPFPLSHSLALNSAALALSRDVPALLPYADEAVRVAGEQGFAPYLAIALLCRGWGLAMTGQHAEGLRQLDEGIALWRRGGYGLASPWFECWRAEAQLVAGQPDAAAATARAAATQIRADGQLQFLAHALTAEADAHAALGAVREADDLYGLALASAQGQGAAGFGLQAAAGRATLWKRTGRGGIAELLQPWLAMIADPTAPGVVRARSMLS